MRGRNFSKRRKASGVGEVPHVNLRWKTKETRCSKTSRPRDEGKSSTIERKATECGESVVEDEG